ncbi:MULTISPECIES: tripartite tricarboxylate transporter permease [Aminobacterium]|jgi:putative tricarboxylic transport membrane protein|uniref:tripartite tricarboxylate transporter permease n=1 Tax=Aminobacterium TaxID=81466 RepID=UPI00257A04BC|nr:tripartite tricarboxylate transporter permease [Aminobacterium sp. UBA4987]
MDGMIAQALGIIFQPTQVLLLVGSVFSGIMVGAAPGLTSTIAIGLLIPVTFTMSKYSAFIMMCGIYCGSIYGGSITAILMNVPGTPTAAVTAMEGWPMTQKGEGGTALGLATYSSSIGGIFSCIVLIFLSLKLARIATLFAGPEYFSLCLLAIIVVFTMSCKSVLKGFIAASFGLLLSTVGLDLICPFPRFTFGIQELTIGIPEVPATIGLLCVAEAFRMVGRPAASNIVRCKVTGIFSAYKYLPKMWFNILRSSIIGTIIGILPGLGATMASFMAYGEAKRASKHPEEYGKGSKEGVVASESANNSVTGGALVPMLTLGIPGDSNTLMMMGAMLIHGLVPGPSLFRDQLDLVYVIFLAMMISNVLLLLMGLFLANFIGKLATMVDNKYMIPFVLVLSIVGPSISYGHVYYFWLSIIFGLIGYFFEKGGFPVLSVAMALVLGPIMEKSLRASLMLPDAGIKIFFTRPYSLAFIVTAILFLVFSVRREIKSRRCEAA